MGVTQIAGRAQDAKETPRATVAGHTPSAGRGAMDSAHRRAMVGAAARQVSSVPNLPSQIPAMGSFWNSGEDLAPLSRGSAGAGQLRPGGDVYRRLLLGGEKGGGAIGPTRRAKGARSWQSRTAMVFLSPWGLQALRHMKPSWSKAHSRSAS